MDIDEGRLGVMQSLADKLIASEGSELRVTSTLDQRESLVGADFVIAAIADGRHGRVGQRPRDPRPPRHRHARRRLDRAGRDHARASATRRRSPEVARNAAEVAPDA